MRQSLQFAAVLVDLLSDAGLQLRQVLFKALSVCRRLTHERVNLLAVVASPANTEPPRRASGCKQRNHALFRGIGFERDRHQPGGTPVTHTIASAMPNRVNHI
jgi:hypothetical protein